MRMMGNVSEITYLWVLKWLNKRFVTLVPSVNFVCDLVTFLPRAVFCAVRLYCCCGLFGREQCLGGNVEMQGQVSWNKANTDPQRIPPNVFCECCTWMLVVFIAFFCLFA
jgi:hypothetical protein